jgi:hypothetical protein
VRAVPVSTSEFGNPAYRAFLIEHWGLRVLIEPETDVSERRSPTARVQVRLGRENQGVRQDTRMSAVASSYFSVMAPGRQKFWRLV